MLKSHADYLAGSSGNVLWFDDILEASLSENDVALSFLQKDAHKSDHPRKIIIVNEGAGDVVALLGLIRLVQYLSQNHILGKEGPLKLVVDDGTGTTAVGIGLGEPYVWGVFPYVLFFMHVVTTQWLLLVTVKEEVGNSWQTPISRASFGGVLFRLILWVLTLQFEDGETFQWSKITTSIYSITLGKIYCDDYGTMHIKGSGNYSCRLKFKEQSIIDRNPHQVSLVIAKGRVTGTIDYSKHFSIFPPIGVLHESIFLSVLLGKKYTFEVSSHKSLLLLNVRGGQSNF